MIHPAAVEKAVVVSLNMGWDSQVVAGCNPHRPGRNIQARTFEPVAVAALGIQSKLKLEAFDTERIEQACLFLGLDTTGWD